MIDEQKLRELAEALKGFGLTSARGVDGDDSGQAELGQEIDGEFYSVGIFDTFQYDEPEVSLKLANFYASANPDAITALLDELATLRSERTAWRVTAENAEAAVKQAREDALEDARQAVDSEELTDPQDVSDDAYNAAVYDCLQAIKSLKGKTP